ncbi:hypothetical protein [Euzebya tangerina]|uniref:hypothetical protein n=1 Tax=Euzebya tangerina TaxID=591198 RepID=UPI000E315130|nr:hypothetical protein [Euzebya tangerina]
MTALDVDSKVLESRTAAMAVSAVLVQLAGEHSNFTVLCGEDVGPAEAFARTWPERLLTVPPLAARVAVAEGVRRAGGQAVVVLEAGIEQLPVHADGGVVMLSQRDDHIRLAFRAGIHVVQPAWVPDVPRLLGGALQAGYTTLLRPPDVLGAIEDAPAPTSIGAHRMFHRGSDGLVIGAGRTAAICREVGLVLARADIGITTMDLHTVTPESGLDAGILADHLLVGPLDSPRAAAMAAVAVDDKISSVVRSVKDVLGLRGTRR